MAKTKTVADVQPPQAQEVPTVPFRNHAGELSNSTDFPQTVDGLLRDGYQHTHTASNGNHLYTRVHPTHNHVYAEVDGEGKVVEVRTTQNA